MKFASRAEERRFRRNDAHKRLKAWSLPLEMDEVIIALAQWDWSVDDSGTLVSFDPDLISKIEEDHAQRKAKNSGVEVPFALDLIEHSMLGWTWDNSDDFLSACSLPLTGSHFSADIRSALMAVLRPPPKK